MLDRIKKNYYLLIITFLFTYFFFNLLDGNRGLISNLEKQEIYKELKLKESDLKLKINDLEHKNSLLGKPGETTYILDDDKKQN